MNYRELYNVSPEEFSYAKDQEGILEDPSMTNEEAICLLSQSFEQIITIGME